MEVYKPSESSLDTGDGVKKPNVFWKIFFWMNMLLSLLIPFVIMESSAVHILDYIDILIFFPLVVVCLFCVAYSKKIFSRGVYTAIFYLYASWSIFYEVIAPYVLGIPSYGEAAIFDFWVIIIPIFLVPTWVALYLLSRDKSA